MSFLFIINIKKIELHFFHYYALYYVHNLKVKNTIYEKKRLNIFHAYKILKLIKNNY